VHQCRSHEAEALFVEAARSKPPNASLWANWGELLEMQGKPDQAILKYRIAIVPKFACRNFRARESAYDRLLSLLDVRKDAHELEALYKQRLGIGAGSAAALDLPFPADQQSVERQGTTGEYKLATSSQLNSPPHIHNLPTMRITSPI
jgi:hypothetical protein